MLQMHCTKVIQVSYCHTLHMRRSLRTARVTLRYPGAAKTIQTKQAAQRKA